MDRAKTSNSQITERRFRSEERPLRIGFYAPALPDSGATNGVVTYIRIMRDALRSLGHSVVVVTTNHIEHSDGRTAELPKPMRLVRRLKLMLEERRADDGSDAWVRLHILDAFRAACRTGIDIFEIEESFGWAGRLAGHGVPIVERLHGPHVYGRDEIETPEQKRLGDIREAAEQASSASVQAITCPSRRLLDSMVGLYGNLPLSRAIPNPMPVSTVADRWRVGRADVDQILCVGRFDLRKGADVAVRAFARALEQRPSLKLVMAGPDPGVMQPNGKLLHFDEFVAKEISPEARSRIRFLGSQSPERIAELRLQSSFALVASRFENFAYSIAEAMAAGMPVLASDSFGNSEMIRDRIDGRIVPIGDVAATADAIVDMVGDPPRLAEMGKSAYERVAEWLAPERIARETVTLYREAIRSRSNPT